MQKRGVSEYVEQRIQNVHKAIRKINEEKELYFDDIPYELISAEVTRRMTTRTVTSIMNIDARKMSIDESLGAVKFHVTMQIFMSNRNANYF